jgi:Protein of unknown function (DUF2975)
MKTDHILKALNVLSWVIFLGLCVEAGGILFNTIFVLIFNSEGAVKFWQEVNLNELYLYNQSHFITQTSLMVIATVLKAILFYQIVKLFYHKSFNLAQPFNEATGKFLVLIGYITMGVGIFSLWGSEFSKNMISRGVQMPDVQSLRLAGADVWLFMSVVLLVIAHMFKKGIELQKENDLTI